MVKDHTTRKIYPVKIKKESSHLEGFFFRYRHKQGYVLIILIFVFFYISLLIISIKNFIDSFYFTDYLDGFTWICLISGFIFPSGALLLLLLTWDDLKKGKMTKSEYAIFPFIFSLLALPCLILGMIRLGPYKVFNPLIESIDVFASTEVFEDQTEGNQDFHLQGKVIVFDYDSKQIRLDVQKLLPIHMTTYNPDEVNFVVGLHATEKTVGRYISKYAVDKRNAPTYVLARQQGFIVNFIDFNKKAKIDKRTIWGPYPAE